MKQADFAYATSDNVDHLGRAVAVHAVRPHVRARVCADISASGVDVLEFDLAGELDSDREDIPADVIVLDCPLADAETLAALTRFDMRAAKAATQLVVWTSAEALDAVFGCLAQSRAQILVDPTPGEHVIALTRALTMIAPMRVRELSDEDRLTLVRLTEQVSDIAARLDRLSAGQPLGEDSAFRLESPADGFKGADDNERNLIRKPRPPLPDPRLVRQIIAQRQARAKFFDRELFADPAWDILLDLTAARAEHTRVSVTSLCIASGVPPTTALRWIGMMSEAGLLVRVEDESDRRRAFIALSDSTADAMARYFAEIGKGAKALI
ncbi:MarR family transcriptional regulator [Tsuneonella mangrovi]|uniref:MarR family transcriptional regulator n=1 Tax=Tsuneonella mangrovi TaxID=1982042 RepID=UPI000BA28274|nr:MarR family transcriptional regulator [Tsuneonella mangrovi]